MIDLRLGRWQDALADIKMVDAVITDPPYGARTHAGNADRVESMGRTPLSYAPWSPSDVRPFVDWWSVRCRGWFAAMTSDDLIPAWRESYSSAGLYDFAPVPILQHRPRLSGDGPGSCAVYLMVARPRSAAFARWGSLSGWYEPPVERDGHIGGKPLSLMRWIVRDYSRPADLVCDPCAGLATTLIAAAIDGRRAIGSEMDPETYAMARHRIDRGYTPDMFSGASAP